MNLYGTVGFNLLVNAIFSFVLAFTMVIAAVRIARRAPARTRVWLLLLPFAKVVSDLCHGIPSGSFFWLKLAGARQELGSFMFGVGVSFVCPVFNWLLGARFHSREYPQSAADLLDSALRARVSPHAPGAIACTLLAIGGLFLVFRVSGWVSFRKRTAEHVSYALILHT
jgi:hypothetical protein